MLQKAYINAEPFKEYITMILIPDANDLGEFEKFPEKEEALLMNNCPSHMKDEIPSILAKA